MGHRVRAKFRCLSILQKYDGLFVAELKPVQQKGDNSEENKLFWSYTPSGECTLNYHAKHPLEVGAYYYIDMDDVEFPDKDGEYWTLGSISRSEGGGGTAELSWNKSYDYQKGRPEGMLYGSLKMWMEPKAEGALNMLSKPGTKWKVSFNFAEASDGTT
jgi:hypothetical protein